jgi:hypothetical protein
MLSVASGPVRLRARLDAPLSRWLWLVKWLLAVPHVVVLVLLWMAFAVLSVVAFVAILVMGRYPHAIFTFNLGVLRWTWRVAYYTYGALGTDRYPPFTMGEAPDYPATLDVAYPQHLSRGLVLVKWWLLAIPHYLVLAFFVGGGSYVAYRAAGPSVATGSWTYGGGLIGLLALIAGVALLFTGRYPRGVFDLLLGLHRWVLRVAAYTALMTDAYPPFRLDLGGADPADLPLTDDGDPNAAVVPPAAAPVPRDTSPSGAGWSVGRVTAVVVGSLLAVTALGLAISGAVLTAVDRAGRDADGFVTAGPMIASTPGYALVADPLELQAEPGTLALGSTLGDVRVSATGPADLFVGIGPGADVEAYLAGVERTRLTGVAAGSVLPGGAPGAPPAQQGFWVASAAGPGAQQLTWTASPGRWAVVVMNADGSRAVTAELTAGVTAPVLPALSTGLLIGGAATLLAGALLVALAVPRGRARGEIDEEEYRRRRSALR